MKNFSPTLARDSIFFIFFFLFLFADVKNGCIFESELATQLLINTY